MIIFCSLLWNINVYAINFEKCFITENFKNYKVRTNFDKDQYERWDYKLFAKNKIRETTIYTDNFIQKNQPSLKDIKDAKKKGSYLITYEKINTSDYIITYADEKYIKAEDEKPVVFGGIKQYVELLMNRSDGKIKKTYLTINNTNKEVMSSNSITYQCSNKKKSGTFKKTLGKILGK